MKIAYLVVAHNTPNHLKRLCQSLSSDGSHFFIHLDKKSNIREYLAIKEPDVTFIEDRIPVYWADFSQVEAILILLKTAFSSPIKFDRFVLLSGSDYPLRSAAYIQKYFQDHTDREFISMVEMPADEHGKPITRLTTFRLRPADGFVINGVKKILRKTGILPTTRDYTQYLTDLVPYGGPTWWALTREAVEYILKFTDERPEVVKFFQNTECPDESFFHTILGDSIFKSRTTGSLTYTDWSAGDSNPAYISERHLDLFAANTPFYADDTFGPREFLFARKFADDSERLVSILDRQIREAGER